MNQKHSVLVQLLPIHYVPIFHVVQCHVFLVALVDAVVTNDFHYCNLVYSWPQMIAPFVDFSDVTKRSHRFAE